MTSEAQSTALPPLDFDRVEALRKHMLMTSGDMASILGVSRVTYYNWVRGKPVRKTNDTQVRRTVKKLLHIIRDHDWPMPEVLAMDQPDRKNKLLEVLATYE